MFKSFVGGSGFMEGSHLFFKNSLAHPRKAPSHIMNVYHHWASVISGVRQKNWAETLLITKYAV